MQNAWFCAPRGAPLSERCVNLSTHTAPVKQTPRSSLFEIANDFVVLNSFLLSPVELQIQTLDPTPLLQPNYQPSSLLRVGPPQCSASVLSPRGFCHLCFSLRIRELVPAVPHESPDQVHAPCTPVAAYPVPRCPIGSSQELRTPLVLTTILRFTTSQQGFTFVRLPDPYLLGVSPQRFDSNAHHHGF